MAQFEVISNRIKGLSSSHRLSCFLSGLKNEIRLPFRMLNPQLLKEAFGLSRIQEEYNWSCKKNSKIQLEQGKPSILDLPKVTSLIDPKTRLPIKRISLAQIEERKKKGLCYNCVEKWAPGHKCENAVFLLDYIEVIHKANSGVQITELDDANGVPGHVLHNQEDAKITLYTLSGTYTFGTMRVMGRIKQKSFVILIDLCSTYNFIDTTLVSQLQIPMDIS